MLRRLLPRSPARRSVERQAMTVRVCCAFSICASIIAGAMLLPRRESTPSM
jgi:hypothetical protein